jgi:hypothetical protein
MTDQEKFEKLKELCNEKISIFDEKHKIRLEEEYLLKSHGENYNNYKRKTKRLL